MLTYQKQLQFTCDGRQTIEITDEINSHVLASEVEQGLCHLFLQHTSASLIICENADPTVRHDLETFMQSIARDGDPRFLHQDEGPDDMSAHIRTVLTQTALTIPVAGGRCLLGQWQGIYLLEHRTQPHRRQMMLTIQGE